MIARMTTKTLALTAIALPLALGLASCGSNDDAETALNGEPVAAVAAPEGQEWSEIAEMTDRNGYLVGNPDAPIKMIEYGSLTCPGCAAFSQQAIEPLMKDYVDTGKVSFEFRSFAIHGPIDLALTRLIDCGSPSQAVPLAEQIWANLPTLLQPVQQRSQQLDAALALPEDQRFVAFAETAGLLDFFAARGISRDQARTCLADAKRLSEIAEYSESYGTQDDIRGTPTFVINGTQLDGGSWESVEAALQRAGAR
ncbi:MAG: protein-disulfide isomerase [Citromicrobium sp.]|nr:protein-disulfide isomerase [Citromicrobium sp.]MAO96753.1 protein-disulfide isomerase [Citromicrobium sp.]MBD77202.1 protein-disulfide isomerase [Citromicrobium sp.]MBT46660.1 protein-disulfide isomerase [Citromicrobium sp.]|tara:strand:+ start:5101 stop:5862 length:762 start_codon:yes stop_codon:yes gene_type:complete